MSPASLNDDDDFRPGQVLLQAWGMLTLCTKTLKPYQLFITVLFTLFDRAHFTHTLYTPCMSEHVVQADVISLSSRVNVCKMTSLHCLSTGRCVWACVPVFLFCFCFLFYFVRFMSHQVQHARYTSFLSVCIPRKSNFSGLCFHRRPCVIYFIDFFFPVILCESFQNQVADDNPDTWCSEADSW